MKSTDLTLDNLDSQNLNDIKQKPQKIFPKYVTLSTKHEWFTNSSMP